MSRTTRVVQKTAAVGERGMVASHNLEAAEAGAQVLRDGGNAIDAVVAMSVVTAVRETAMNSVGGVGVLLVHSAATGETSEISFYGRTPSALSEDVFVPHLLPAEMTGRSSMGWRRVADARNERGYLSVGVPGYVAGVGQLHEQLGTLPWSDLLTPAERLAREGFDADDEDTFYFASHLGHIRMFEEMARIFTPGGLPPIPGGFYQGPGTRVIQSDLADTIRALRVDGPRAFYHGDIPVAIASHVQAGGGVLSIDDFARFQPESGSGLRGSYRGYDIVTCSGPNGGLTLLQMLNLAEQFDIGGVEHSSAEHLHLLTEIMRQSWTDRFAYVGDPDGITVPIDALTSKDYARDLAANLHRHRAPRHAQAGDPWPHSAIARPTGSPTFAGDPGGRDTTHVTAADAAGNMVSLTQTLGLGFGSCVIAPGTGALLYDVTMWMNPEPGTPNSVGPWKKQLGHATPTLLFKDGEPVAALGAPGGRRVVTSIFQTILNMVDYGMDVQQAIGAPRIHCEGADPAHPNGPAVHQVLIDDRVPSSTLVEFAARGHEPVPCRETSGQSYFAKPLGIQRSNGKLVGGVDVFRKSVAIGV